MCACSITGGVAAQDANVHWAYASFFGTGRYTLDGRADTTVITVAPRWTWREPQLTASGERRIGIRFRFPISVGAYEFATLNPLDELTIDSFNAVSFVPGAELEIPMTERWRLKGLAFAGYGSEMGGGPDATIFRLGFRSQFTFQFDDIAMNLVNAVERMGYSSSSRSSGINMVTVGLDFSRALEDKRFLDDVLMLHWQVAYTSFPDRLGVDLPSLSVRPDSNFGEWEVGFGFGKRGGRIEAGILKLDRIGLSYRLGAGGDLTGVAIVFRSLFDR